MKKKAKQSDVTYRIHVLAVLRASVEGVPAGTYFGSTAGLSYWIDEAVADGLINADMTPTDLGRSVAEQGRLSDLPKCRQIFWDSPELRSIKGNAWGAI